MVLASVFVAVLVVMMIRFVPPFDQCLILLRGEFGNLLHESDDAPDAMVIVSLAPSRHRGHLDPVLHDPEHFSRARRDVFGQVGRCGIESFAKVGLVDTWGEMALGAHGSVMFGALGDEMGSSNAGT